MEMRSLDLGGQAGAIFIFVAEFFSFFLLQPVVSCTHYELFFITLWVVIHKALSFEA